MPKLVFRVDADTSPVKKFRTEIEQVEKTMIRIKSENFSFNHWLKEFDRLKTELEKKKEQIANLKKEILSINPISNPKATASLEKEYAQAKKDQESLVHETVNLGNKFGKAYDDLVATLEKAQKVTDGVTAKLIEQKRAVANLQSEVRVLNAEYKNADKDKKADILAQKTSKTKELEQERVTLNALRAEQERAKLSVKGLSDETRNYEKVVGKVAGAQAEANLVMGRFESTLLKIGGLTTLQRFASDVIRVRGEFQKTQVAFETMLGSKEKADSLMAQMIKTAAKTPFDLQGVANGAKQLLAYGTEAKNVNDTLIRLGNIASGLSIPLGDLVYLYGTTQTQGRLFTQDVRQFMGRGIPLVKELASMLGKTEEEINKMVTAGEIGFPQVEAVIKKMTDEGGKFYNLMEKQSQTLSGQISNLGDAWNGMLNSIGEDTQGLSSATISMATSIVENYEEIGRILIGLIATYGVYKTATIAYFAITKTYGIYDIATKELQFAATMKNIVATKALAVQQSLLNRTMLANPYVLVATLAVGAAAAIWAFADHTTTAEKAQKRFNDSLSSQKQHLDDLKRSADELIGTIKSETATQYDKMDSYLKLQKIFPEVFKNMDIEKIKLMDLVTYEKLLAEARNRREVVGAKTNLVLKTNAYNEAKTKYSNTSSKNSNILSYYAQMKAAEEDMKLAKKQVDDIERIRQEAKEKNKPVEVKLLEAKNNRDQILQEFLSAKMTLEEEQQKIKESGFGVIPIDVQIRFDNAEVQLANIDTTITSLIQGKSTQTYKEAYDTAKKEWKAAQKALEESKKKSKEDYVKAKKDLDDKEKTYKDLGGVTNTSKQESAAEKLRQQQEKYALLMDKQALEQKRSAEDLQIQTDQARINAMREGSNRTLEQMKLDHQKEMQQLDRQQEDLLRKRIEDRKAEFDAKENEKEAKNPKYVKQTFNGSNVALSQSEKDAFSNQKMYLSIQQAGETQSQFEREREAWNSYLIEYGNFQQKKEAIANEYNHKIAKAATEGEKASIGKEKENKLKEVHFDELKSSINFANIFGDLDAQSTEAITKMRDKLKEIIEASAKDLKPTDLKFLQDALTNINLKIADRTPFGELKQGIDSYKNATISVIKAQGDLNTVQQGGEVIIGTYIDKTGKICKELLTQEQAEKNLSRAQNDRSFAQAQLTKSINSIGENGKQLVQAGSDITNMLTDLGVQIPESVKGTLDGVGQVMDSMASIDLMKPMSIVTGITGVLAGIGKTIGSIFGGESTKTKVYEDMKEQLSAINEIYEKIIANSKEEITFGGGFASIKAAEDALDTYYKKIQNYRSVAEAGGEAGASAGSHSYAYRANKGLSGDWGNISGIIGQNISSVQEMYNLTGEQLYLIQTKFPEAWRKIPSEITDSLNAIINCKDEANELADALNAAMTGVDMNGFYNGFIDSLSDMDTSFEDMCDNFEGYLRKSIMAGLISSQYQSRINDLYKKWSDAAVSDKKITEDESKALRGEYKEIVEEMMKDREEMAKSFGWEISSESTSQSSTKGGFETMSQDTGSELNGRFTALQISGEEIKNQSTLQSQSLNLLTLKSEDILRVNSEIRNIADETRDLIANSYLELVQISENTGAIIKPIQQMQKDMAEVKKNTSKL